MEATIYSQKGESKGKLKLPESVFGVKWNADLVHQVVSVMQGNERQGSAHTKDRGEVRGGGKKPWQQKGTGRARHGSIRSPLWVGGGVTHGPRKEKNYKRDIPKSMKSKALAVVLSKKMKDGEVGFIDNLTFSAPKTKEALAVMKSLSSIAGFERTLLKKKNSLLIALPKRNAAVEKSFSNFGNVMVEETRNLNPMELLNYKHLFIVDPENSISVIEKLHRI